MLNAPTKLLPQSLSIAARISPQLVAKTLPSSFSFLLYCPIAFVKPALAIRSCVSLSGTIGLLSDVGIHLSTRSSMLCRLALSSASAACCPEALAHPGTNVAGLFIYTAPRFHFSRSQRALLQHALMGETCERVAASLSLSPWTVKKRWRAIYERVMDVDNELLPPPIAYGVHVSSRGEERRRHLLNYLRQHLEELRPYESRPQRRRMGRTLFSAIKVFMAGTAFFDPDWLPCLSDCLL
jgi:DNA-binding CsgD family transcriptional regulator